MDQPYVTTLHKVPAFALARLPLCTSFTLVSSTVSHLLAHDCSAFNWLDRRLHGPCASIWVSRESCTDKYLRVQSRAQSFALFADSSFLTDYGAITPTIRTIGRKTKQSPKQNQLLPHNRAQSSVEQRFAIRVVVQQEEDRETLTQVLKSLGAEFDDTSPKPTPKLVAPKLVMESRMNILCWMTFHHCAACLVACFALELCDHHHHLHRLQHQDNCLPGVDMSIDPMG